MFVILRLRKIIGCFTLFLGICLLLIGGKLVFKYNSVEIANEVFEPGYVVVIDAGHGYPDGGATAINGINESDLNLQVAKILEEKLIEIGFDVIMTRNDENNIADSELQNSTIKKIKVTDINNRIEIVNKSKADMLISIHMNKFSEEKYFGWQTFYKKGSEISKVLAQKVQIGISNNISRENNRTILPINNIKLIDKSQIPAIIVECGFLSNHEDVRLLQTEEYKNQIADGIVEGIEEFYNIDK